MGRWTMRLALDGMTGAIPRSSQVPIKALASEPCRRAKLQARPDRATARPGRDRMPARGERHGNGVAERVDDHVNLGRQPASRSADGLAAPPFLRAPALCWWARTMVASIIMYSLSRSSAKALKIRAKTPLSHHLRKRLWVFFQSPNRSGSHATGCPLDSDRGQPPRKADCSPRCRQRGLPGREGNP